MKTHLTILLTICCVLLAGNISAQCPSGSITLSSQQQVDDFALTYPGCTQILGTLTIESGSNTPITNLNGLANITSIANNLDILNNDNLPSLAGLESLNVIGGECVVFQSGVTSLEGLDNLSSAGSIYLRSNENLATLASLENISSLTGFLWVWRNHSLTSLEGLENITTVAEGVSIWQNNNLASVDLDSLGIVQDGLNISENSNLVSLQIGNLSAVEGGFSIKENENLTSLQGLDSLYSVEGKLWVYNNPSLINFQGLGNLHSVEELDIDLNSSLENLSGLESLNFIGGDVKIDGNYNMTALSGLENLNSIGGYLSITFNESLTNLSGLDNLNSIGGILSISINQNLTSLSGLENLNSIGGGTYLTENYSLVDLSGLESLNSIGGEFWMNDNSLTNLEGLNNLTTIGGELYIWSSFESFLVSLDGLDNLTTIGGSLRLDYELLLSDISALSNLTSIAGDLRITETGISDLSALQNIDHNNITELSITNNSQLSLCGVESICNYLANGGESFINDNAEGCNTIEEIIQSCSTVWEYAVEGNIFADLNEDCLPGTSETDLASWIVKVENAQGTRYAYTYNDGRYTAPVDTGTYTVTAIPPNSLWEDVCFESDIAVLTPLVRRDTIDFGASTGTFCPLLEVDVTAPFVRRCFDSNYYVRYCNSGTAVAENAYVEVQLDPFFTYQNATITGIDLGENLYSFDLGNVDIGECSSFRVDVYVDCDSTLLGQTHCVEARIFPDSICTPALPLWDGSSIRVDAQCLGDSIEFKIENIGTGDMSDSLEYIIVEDDLIYQRSDFQLNSGDNIKLYKQANGAFHRLEAEQSPGHPGNSMPSVFVEGCGENDNGEISIGFVNYYLLDEGDAYVSIDCQGNVGAYDPNDKQAFPVGYGTPHYITDSTDLEYMIRFQNTGTDTAFNIVIRDMISPHLNIETLRPGVASHPYRYDIDSSNIAVFHFENIMLPDSNVNEPASNGFIKFNIEQKRDNPIGTHIMNEAAIYFDFNEPIITNTVFHTVGEDFMGIVTSIITPPEVQEAGIFVNIFPNPFDKYTRFEVQGEVVKKLQLSVYDMMGREVLQQESTHQQHITMKRNNLTPGVYVFRLMGERKQLATGKLVVK